MSDALSQRKFEEPFFAIYDETFLSILGEAPNVELALKKDWPFAHEAGVYFPDEDVCWITSNTLRNEDGPSIKIGKMTRSEGKWQYEEIRTGVTMGNGGINYRGGVLFCDQGNLDEPGGLVLMDTKPPYATKTLISSFHWRLFSSVNDVVIHTDGSIWFTDPTYGHDQGFRHAPQLPTQVYRFEPESGDIRAVADGFGRCNGLCFSPDEQVLYVTDTDWIHGDGTTDLQRSSSM